MGAHIVGGAPSDRVGDRVGVRIGRSGRHVYRLYARGEVEFLDPEVRAGAYTGGAKLELTRLRLRRRNELADGGDTSWLTCDEHVGLARERNDRDEILQRVIWEILRERGTVCLSVGVYK